MPEHEHVPCGLRAAAQHAIGTEDSWKSQQVHQRHQRRVDIGAGQHQQGGAARHTQLQEQQHGRDQVVHDQHSLVNRHEQGIGRQLLLRERNQRKEDPDGQDYDDRDNIAGAGRCVLRTQKERHFLRRSGTSEPGGLACSGGCPYPGSSGLIGENG